MMASSERVTLKVDGAAFRQWTAVEIGRDLKDISGGFRLDYTDEGRAKQALPNMIAAAPFFRIVRAGMPCTIAIDGELVLVGYIDDVTVGWTGRQLTARVQGRDKTGDLVDCAALPEGPAEFRNVDLLHVARLVCAPFGITVRAEIDVGEPFERLSINPHETALAFLEKAARQRTALLVSDGVGGLLITRGGKGNGPAALTVPGNIQEAEFASSWRGRFSDVYVKGQTDAHGRRHGLAPALDHTAVPPGSPPAPPPATAATTEASTILMTGHARDPEITRHRPTVRLTRSQSGMSTTQEQAEWAVRVERGLGDVLTYSVLDWRAGTVDPKTKLAALWRPNEVVPVVDPWADIDKPMLIAGVSYSEGREGLKTRLRLAGVTAFDRINEAEKRKHRTTAAAVKRSLSSDFRPLEEGP